MLWLIELVNRMIESMLSNVILSGAMSTLLAAFLIFVFKEYIKRPPNFSGVFEIECKTLQSSYNSYVKLTTF